VTVATLSSQPVAVLASSRLAGDDQHAAGRAQQSAIRVRSPLPGSSLGHPVAERRVPWMTPFVPDVKRAELARVLQRLRFIRHCYDRGNSEKDMTHERA
jgi:hypothetical protein